MLNQFLKPIHFNLSVEVHKLHVACNRCTKKKNTVSKFLLIFEGKRFFSTYQLWFIIVEKICLEFEKPQRHFILFIYSFHLFFFRHFLEIFRLVKKVLIANMKWIGLLKFRCLLVGMHVIKWIKFLLFGTSN